MDGGINFGVAAAMYINKNVTIWTIPYTLAGDLGLTILIQTVITWFLLVTSTTNDLRLGKYPALLPPKKKCCQNAFFMWFLINYDLLEPKIKGKERLKRIGRMLLRCLLYSVFVFIIFWPITIGVLIGVWGNGLVWKGWFYPQVFKLVVSGIIGFFETPVIAYIALVSYAVVKKNVNTKFV